MTEQAVMRVITTSFVFLAVALLAAGAMIVVSFSIWTQPSSAAQTTPPAYTHTWYVTNPDPSWMYIRGAADGSFDNATCTRGTTVLDFGQPEKSAASSPYGGYGTRYFAYQDPFISDADIVVAAVNYAKGWWDYTGTCPSLDLAIGTNNYDMLPENPPPPNNGNEATAGAYWAQVAYDVQQYINALGWNWQIATQSGSDMEQPSNPYDPIPDPNDFWDCAAATKNFVNGYHFNPNARRLVDFGTAWAPTVWDLTCWTDADVYYVAYQMPHDFPLPEIYVPGATGSWVDVRSQYYMFFLGVMTTCNQGDPLPYYYCTTPPGWFAPSGAWWHLWTSLNNAGYGQGTLDYATNIRLQP